MADHFPLIRISSGEIKDINSNDKKNGKDNGSELKI